MAPNRRNDSTRRSQLQTPRQSFTQTLTVDRQSAARATLLRDPGAFVAVVRGTPRAAVFRCPCGCGDTLVANTDPKTGPAWRLRLDADGATLMPSVWRTTGCGSHFIVWRSRIWWCRSLDRSQPAQAEDVDESEWPTEMDSELLEEWRRIPRRVGKLEDC